MSTFYQNYVFINLLFLILFIYLSTHGIDNSFFFSKTLSFEWRR